MTMLVTWVRWQLRQPNTSGSTPLLLSAAVRATAACSQTLSDSCCKRYRRAEEGALTVRIQYSSYPEIKQNPPGGVAGRVAWIGAGDRGAGAPIGGCGTWRLAHSPISRCTSANGSTILKDFS